jgi:magnesium transporter
MRGIALRELVPGTTGRLLLKESFGALINGVAVAIGTGAAVFLWDGRPGLVLIIGRAMVVNMAAAGLAGAATPLVLQALGRNPAQSASIFLTTVTHVAGFAAFVGFAVLFMPMLV